MPDVSRLDRLYAQLLLDHPYGWALFKKVTRRDISPGCCGYFDPDGDWHGIANLNDEADLTNQGWKIPNAGIISNRSPESMTWGPKISGCVKASHVGGTVGATIPNTPVEASVTALFKTEGQHGAVLMTQSPVTRHEVGDERSAVQWMVDNKREMFDRNGAVFRKHGIWIVTKTYSTRRCAVAIMGANSSTVEISLGADAQGLLTLTPKSAWSNSTASCSTEMHADDADGVVVFISGIYFCPKLFGLGMSQRRDQNKQKGKIFRDDSQDDAEDSDELSMVFYPPLDETIQ